MSLVESKSLTPEFLVKDFRNLIVHEYFGVDGQIVWDLTTKELDELVDNIKKLKAGVLN